MGWHWFLRLGVIAGGLAAVAAMHGGGWVVLYWPAASFGVVAVGYLSQTPVVFGKRPDGSLPALRFVALLPVHAATRMTFALWKRSTKEPGHTELCDGLLIGRRPRPDELPGAVRGVLDLTSEFAAPRALRDAKRYRCEPILDGTAVPPARLLEVVRTLDSLPRPSYLHCAQGHGRTAMVAAAWLLVTGRAGSAEEALDAVRRARPGAVPNRFQARAVHDLERSLPGTRDNEPVTKPG